MRLTVAFVLICSASVASEPRYIPRQEIWGINVSRVSRLLNYSFANPKDAECLARLDLALNKNPPQLTNRSSFTALLLSGTTKEVIGQAVAALGKEAPQSNAEPGDNVHLIFVAPQSEFRFVLDRLSIDGAEIAIDYFYQDSGGLKAVYRPVFVAKLGVLPPGRYTVKATPSYKRLQSRNVLTKEGSELMPATPVFDNQQITVSPSQASHGQKSNSDVPNPIGER